MQPSLIQRFSQSNVISSVVLPYDQIYMYSKLEPEGGTDLFYAKLNVFFVMIKKRQASSKNGS